jgi:N-methylhydantoinase B
MVEDALEAEGEEVTLQLRQENFEQRESDVYAVVWSAAGGFGDPTDRDAEHVLDDWRNGAVTLAAARTIYGVVIDDKAGTLDVKATKALREETRRKRVAGIKVKPRKLSGPSVRVTENLLVRLDGESAHHCCAKCDGDLGPTRDNYKDHCVREDNPIQASSPLVGDPRRYIDDEPVFRQFFCPGCGTLIENEIAVTKDPILRDIEVIVDDRLLQRQPEAAD